MTTLGWIFMGCSVGFVIGLVSYCFFRVLSKPAAADHMHAPADIDTHDVGT